MANGEKEREILQEGNFNDWSYPNGVAVSVSG